MSLNSWRQVQLFENTPIVDPHFGKDRSFYSDPTLSAVSPLSDERLAIAVQDNKIKIVSLDTPELLLDFEAYSGNFRITYLESLNENYLMSVGESAGNASLIKIWNLDNPPKNEHEYHTIIKIKNGDNTFPISAISISQDLTCIIVGFANGKIILIRGDLYRDRGSRQRIIYDDVNKEPVTALFLNWDNTFCFASTTSRIMVFNTTGRNYGEPDLILNNNIGADLNCSCISSDKFEMICWLRDSIDFYRSNGEKHSIVVDIHTKKRIISINKDRLMIICGIQQSNNTTSLNIKDFSITNNRVMILDLKNKVIVMNLLVSNTIIDVYTSTIKGIESIFLLTLDGIIHKITEKSINEQLQIIVQKDLYPLALDFSEQYDIPLEKVQQIKKAYGDYLYKKMFKKDAIEQYIQCIDITETSEIISKFGIDGTSNLEDLTNLSKYLWGILKAGLAKSDHITLLLTVLSKLKDTAQIDLFINHFTREGSFVNEPENEESWNIDDETYFYSENTLFDLDMILGLLQGLNMKIQSYKLARKFSKDPTTIVDVILYSLDDPSCALRYIKSLPVEDTLRILISYSNILLEKLPNDTNALLIDVFTGIYQPTKYKDEDYTNKQTKTDEKPVFHSYHAFFRYMNVSNRKFPRPEREIVSPTYHPPKPSLIFPSFIDKPFQFVVFLEACLDSYNKYQGYDHDKQEILTTLYDTYLLLSQDDLVDRRDDWKSKAINIMEESNNITKVLNAKPKSPHGENSTKSIDNSLMLLISHMNNIDPYFFSKSNGDSIDVENLQLSNISNKTLLNTFRSMILAGEVSKCLTFLEKFGQKDYELYRMALRFFTSTKKVYEEMGGDGIFKAKVLDPITSFDIMSPLEIIQTLSLTNVTTFGILQEFLISHIQSEAEEYENNGKLIGLYEHELETKQNMLHDMLDPNKPMELKINNRPCQMCNTALELPIVYFKCDHIYHQGCLNEEENSQNSDKLYRCPHCILDIEASGKMSQLQIDASNDIDLLKWSLSSEENSNDRFKVVSEFIGKGGLESSPSIME